MRGMRSRGDMGRGPDSGRVQVRLLGCGDLCVPEFSGRLAAHGMVGRAMNPATALREAPILYTADPTRPVLLGTVRMWGDSQGYVLWRPCAELTGEQTYAQQTARTLIGGWLRDGLPAGMPQCEVRSRLWWLCVGDLLRGQVRLGAFVKR